MSHTNPRKPFYGKHILRRREQAFIEKITDKYRNRTIDKALQEELYEELSTLKAQGKISIPFKVLLIDLEEERSPRIEVILESKL